MSSLDEVTPTVNINSTASEALVNDEKLALFVLWGLILPPIAAAGLVGNILTIIVLWRKEMHSTTILYLRALVITDTGILIGSIITLTPRSCANYLQTEPLLYFNNFIYPHIHAPGYYLIMTLQQCNVWITVSVSMERYIAICHPFRSPRLITRRKTIIVLASIVIGSLIYNIPHLLAYSAVPCNPLLSTMSPVQTFTGNGSEGYFYYSPLEAPTTFSYSSLELSTTQPSPDSNCVQADTTIFGRTQFYNIYRTVMYSILIYVVPFLALLILNSFLIRELMTMQRRRTGTNIHEENEANLSMVLVLIVIVFIFCQTPGLISQFDLINDDVFVYWLAVSNTLFTTNSAVNFLIYTAFGRKFRRVLLRLFRHLFTRSRRFSQSSARSTHYTNDYTDGHDSAQSGCSSSLRLKACCKKEREPTGDAAENIPLNTLRKPGNSSLNGVASNKWFKNGNGRKMFPNLEEDSERDALDSNTSMETVPESRHSMTASNRTVHRDIITASNSNGRDSRASQTSV